MAQQTQQFPVQKFAFENPPMKLPSQKVYVVDDDGDLRQSMVWLAESAGLQMKVYASAEDFLEDFDSKEPGCLVTDIRMPGMNGLDLQQHLSKKGIDIPVIVMTAFGDAQSAVRALKAGAYDFIEKPFKRDAMVDLLRAGLAADLERRRDAEVWAEIGRRIALLTRREREVMRLVVSGKANREIGGALGIGLKTVEAHRSKVMSKMKAGSLAELVMLVNRWSEIRPERQARHPSQGLERSHRRAAAAGTPG